VPKRFVHGVTRTETDYVWPNQLVRPAGDVPTVYLDLNHWIGLAKANARHRDGARHRAALEALRSARSSGRFSFPLSATHYMEMAPIADPRQRADIATVMEELSGLATIVSRTIIMRLQAYRRAADRKLRAPRVVYSSKGALRRPNGLFRSARALVLAVRVTTQGGKGS
jgi:hypothetical protein